MQPGDVLRLAPVAVEAHVFDAESGNRVSSPAPVVA